MNGFWAMGGYALYVWPCVGLTGAVLVWNVWAARRLQAAALARVARVLAMTEIDSQ